MNPNLPELPLSVGCAIAGGVLGHFVFLWLARHGFYALLVPGGLVGFGGGVLARTRSIHRGIIRAVLALLAGILAEWRLAPFVADTGFGYFFTHLQNLNAVTVLLIAAGTVCGYYLSVGPLRQSPVQGYKPCESAALRAGGITISRRGCRRCRSEAG